MGKLDLIKGQPAYLVEESKKRKKPHESDHGENTTGRSVKVKKPRRPKNAPEIVLNRNDPPAQWKTPNHQFVGNPLAPTIQMYPAPHSAFHVTAMPGSSKVSGSSFSTDPLRPAKRAKAPAYSTFIPTINSMCLLCGGPKHNLRDCPIPKGGIEK